MKTSLLAIITSLLIFTTNTPVEGKLPPEMNGLTNVFIDIADQYWAAAWINELYAEGITGGCGQNPLRYCPEENVTRAQMAIFILRTLHGSTYQPPVTTNIFSDVPSSYWAAAWINALYNEGITGGCGVNPLTFCPDQTVTRAQMAVFLLRTIHGSTYLPPASSNIFTDVDSTFWAKNWINQLYTEGITSGCSQNPLSYCPNNNVTRAEMSIFLLRAKHGASYQPPPIIPANVIILTGSGDSVVDVSKWDGPAILDITYTGGSNFIVWSYGSDGERIDLLVNTIGAYRGKRPIDFRSDEHTVRFEIKSSGSWEIWVLPLEYITQFNIPGTYEGTGDDVIALVGGTPDLLTADASMASHNFII
jgi:hypothetical protein